MLTERDENEKTRNKNKTSLVGRPPEVNQLKLSMCLTQLLLTDDESSNQTECPTQDLVADKFKEIPKEEAFEIPQPNNYEMAKKKKNKIIQHRKQKAETNEMGAIHAKMKEVSPNPPRTPIGIIIEVTKCNYLECLACKIHPLKAEEDLTLNDCIRVGRPLTRVTSGT